MVERSCPLAVQSGYLRFDGQGGCSVEEMSDLLRALDASYQAIAGVELAAQATLSASLPSG
jgi:hypothetical protein